MAERFVTTIFCDDVRQEQFNKLSYMGVYTGELISPEFPLTLPKFCIIVTVNTPKDEPFEEMTVVITNGEREVARAELKHEEMASFQTAAFQKAENGELAWIAVRLVIELAGLKFEEPTVLRTRVSTEKGDMNGPALRIRKGMPG